MDEVDSGPALAGNPVHKVHAVHPVHDSPFPRLTLPSPGANKKAALEERLFSVGAEKAVICGRFC